MDQLLIHAMDKYGPLGVALFVVCLLLWAIVTRVFPSMNKTWSEQAEAERAIFREALGLMRDELKQQHADAGDRHEQVIGKLAAIDGKVDRLLPKL